VLWGSTGGEGLGGGEGGADRKRTFRINPEPMPGGKKGLPKDWSAVTKGNQTGRRTPMQELRGSRTTEKRRRRKVGGEPITPFYEPHERKTPRARKT